MIEELLIETKLPLAPGDQTRHVPFLRNRSEAAIVRSVTSPSCQPIHATSRRNAPPRMSRIAAVVWPATLAMAEITACILGRPIARWRTG